MNRIWTALLTSALGATACAQSADLLYAPARTVADQGITLKAWGSGSASQTDEAAFAGAYSIRMSTRNLFQGGIIDYKTGHDVTKQFDDKNNLLRLTFRLADGSAIGFGGSTGGRTGGPMGGPGGPMGGPMGGPGGGMMGGPMGGPMGGRGGSSTGGRGSSTGGRGGQTGPGGGMMGGPMGGPGGMMGGPMGGRGGSSGMSTELTLKTMRLIVATSDGKRSEIYLPANTSLPNENGWRTISVPLQGIKGFDRTNKVIQSIAISGDATSTFYVGDLRVINDSTPIRGSIDGSQKLNLALGDTITLNAIGNGGSSILKYSWDFDDTDGIQSDAEGRSIQRRFRKAGDFVVTLTITDYYGLKAPFQTTLKVKVNP